MRQRLAFILLRPAPESSDTAPAGVSSQAAGRSGIALPGHDDHESPGLISFIPGEDRHRRGPTPQSTRQAVEIPPAPITPWKLNLGRRMDIKMPSLETETCEKNSHALWLTFTQEP